MSEEKKSVSPWLILGTTVLIQFLGWVFIQYVGSSNASVSQKYTNEMLYDKLSTIQATATETQVSTAKIQESHALFREEVRDSLKSLRWDVNLLGLDKKR